MEGVKKSAPTQWEVTIVAVVHHMYWTRMKGIVLVSSNKRFPT